VLEGARGTLVVANSRQYALRIDPARRADMSDGLLDLVFLPGRGAASMALWGLRCRLRRPIERRGAVYLTGREVRITSEEPAPYQIDGDSPGWRGAGLGGAADGDGEPLSLRVCVWPGAMRVLTPVAGGA
jgi:diacylglycerol kinase family enzyme